MNVAILGASKKPERYAHRALLRLRQHGHRVFPVNPALSEVEGIPAYRSLGAIPEAIHTLTVYVGPRHIGAEIDAIVALRPQRVILNPGTESPDLEAALDAAGIPWLHACTLVMLSSKQF